MPTDQAPYAAVAEAAAELNQRARGRAIGDSRTTFDSYAFHVGGRTELQFNIGLESGDEDLRYGVAFSLENQPDASRH